MTKTASLLFKVATLTLLTGCATIINSPYQSVGITSNPSNACVWVDSAYAGRTPMIVQMSRKNNHLVRIELEGYQPYEAIFSRKVSGWVLGNLVFGGVIGLAVDAVSGGIYMLTPEQMQAELRSNHIASKQTKDSYITVVLEPNTSWKKVGNLVASN